MGSKEEGVKSRRVDHALVLLSQNVRLPGFSDDQMESDVVLENQLMAFHAASNSESVSRRPFAEEALLEENRPGKFDRLKPVKRC
jgi:hypothetical protein